MPNYTTILMLLLPKQNAMPISMNKVDADMDEAEAVDMVMKTNMIFKSDEWNKLSAAQKSQ